MYILKETRIYGSSLSPFMNILIFRNKRQWPLLTWFSSVAQLCPTLCDPTNCSTPGLCVHHHSRSLPKPRSIKSVMPSNQLILCHPLLLPSIFPSIRVFSNELGLFQWVGPLHQVAKVLELQLQHQSFQEHPGLNSFRMDWLDLLAVQRTPKSLLQHYSSKASILRGSAFFTVQLSQPHMTTGKTIALTRRTSVGNVMSLLLNMLSN